MIAGVIKSQLVVTVLVLVITMRIWSCVVADRTRTKVESHKPKTSTGRLFSNQMETYDAVNGTRVELPCHIELKLSASDFTNVSWLKMPRRILTRGPLRVTRDNRIHLLPQTVMNTADFSLIIDPVRERDAGEYRCLFQLGSELHHKVVILVVKVPPYFDERPAKVVKADERGNLRLFCNASGAPQPKLRWWVRLSSTQLSDSTDPIQTNKRSRTQPVHETKPEEDSLFLGKERLKPIEAVLSRYQNDIFVRGGLLVFSRLSRHMSGWYLCEAHNGIPPPALSLSRVLIRYPPEIRMSNSEIQQHLGGNTIISCTVRAYPPGTVEWELNGVPIHAPYCGYFEMKKLKYCQIEYHKVARDRGPLSDSNTDQLNPMGTVYSQSVDSLPQLLDADEHEFYRLSDVRLTVANITHADLGLYTCRVRTSAGVGEGYTRLEAHPQIYPHQSLYPGLSRNLLPTGQLVRSLKAQMAAKINRSAGQEPVSWLKANKFSTGDTHSSESTISSSVAQTGLKNSISSSNYLPSIPQSRIKSPSFLARTSIRDHTGPCLAPSIQTYLYTFLSIQLFLNRIIPV